jgi:hypothetical protein
MIIRTLTAAALVLVALGITDAACADVAGPACWKLGNNDGTTGYFVRVEFGLGDFKGQAVCQVPSGAASGCDQGPFAWTPVACP